MNHSFYPLDWPALAREIKEGAGYVCQVCGRQCRRPGEFNLGWQYQLTVAHWDNDYEGEAIFVVACCLPCHFAHDCAHAWKARKRHERWRRRAIGQLEMDLR